MTKKTLGSQIGSLTEVEKLHLITILNEYGELNYVVHPGLLPFVSVDKVFFAFSRATFVSISKNGKAFRARMLSKLRYLYVMDDSVTWPMYLNPRKVVKRFGSNIGKGVRIAGLPKKRVTVGVKWSLPKRQHIPDDDVHVDPMVLIKPTPVKGHFLITCEARHRPAVSSFLADHCL